MWIQDTRPPWEIQDFRPLCTWWPRARTTVPALTLTLAIVRPPRAHAGPIPACPRPPRLPAGQSISTLIALQFTILPAKRAAINFDTSACPRPPRPLNLIPRRGRSLHRAPLRSGRQLKLTRRPARVRHPTRRPASPAVPIKFDTALARARRLLPAALAQRPLRL